MGHKNGVGGLGRTFGMGSVGPLNFDVGKKKKGVCGVGVRYVITKVLLKISQNLQENICAGVSC